jgi:tetratricopeptide (TPR) repeat protein
MQCVAEQSAKWGKTNIGLDVDHYGLNKFTSRTDDKYVLVCNHLLKIIVPITSQKQPRIYSVSIDTVDSYTERPTLSAAVAEKLRVHHSPASVPYALAIHGLGGSGKTQLALKYVEDHRDEYSPILWIDAKDEESVRASFERCANELHLQGNSSQSHSTCIADLPSVRAVLQWLRNRKDTDDRWLVVVDNADDVTWGIKKVMPKGKLGSIIVTSQDGDSRKLIGGGCEELRVGTMKLQEARALILRHLTLDLDPVPEDTLRDCDKIAERLGCLALAVDLAGAYISNDDTNPRQALRQYLVDYTRHQDQLLQSEHYRGMSTSDKTVWTVWDTTLEMIETRYAHLQPGLVLAFLARFKGVVVQDELLRLTSLGMSRICEDLYGGAVELPTWLDKALTVENREWDDYFYRESRRVLVRYSLLQRVEGEWPGVSMHGLVQWRARKHEEEQPWDKWHLIAVVAGCAQLSKDNARPQFRRELVVHVPTVQEVHLDGLDVEEEGKGVVWNTFSKVLYDEGRWAEAEEVLVQMMGKSTKMLGREHPNTLRSMNNLASTYRDQGRWTEAEELFVQVVEASKRVFGGKHPNTLTSIGNLASTYKKQGRCREAEELEVHVLEIETTMFDPEHHDTLNSMDNLALTYSYQERWTKAEELGVQVLKMKTRVLGPEHPDTLTSMLNLASTYKNQERWKEAEELEVQVLEIRTKLFGLEHPNTLNIMGNLALTYSYQERWTKAEELGVQVLKMKTRVLGPEHPDILCSMKILASTYKQQGRWTEVEELELQIMEKSRKVLGPEHLDTLDSMNNLALTYWNQRRWTDAEELQVQAMEKSTKVLGPEHLDTLGSMNNLATTYWNQGRWTEAEELLVQAMEKNTRVLGPEHPDTLLSMANLAETYSSQGRWTEAEALQVQVMEKNISVLGAEHPNTLLSMTDLAATYQKQGRWTEAEELEVQVIEKRTRVLGAKHPETLTSMANLVHTLKSQGKGDAAIALKQQILELGREFFTKNPFFLSSFVPSAKAELERSSKTD